MSDFVLLNGSVCSSKEISYQAFHRAIHYGDCLYESMRMINGSIPLLPRHIDRLSQGMAIMKMHSNRELVFSHLSETISALSQANKLTDARLRLTVIRKAGGHYAPVTSDVDVLVEMQPYPPEVALNEKGLEVGLFTDYPVMATPLSRFKSANAQAYVFAGMHCQENKCR